MKYKVGEIVYLVESSKYVREGKVTCICGDILSIKFVDGMGGTKVKEHRLFPSEEAAFASIPTYRKDPLLDSSIWTVRAIMQEPNWKQYH